VLDLYQQAESVTKRRIFNCGFSILPQILSDAAAASAQQLALMPNLPAVNLGGQLLQIQRTLQEMQQTMQQQGQQLVQQGQQLVQIRQEISRS
jgi:hypothetical protein